MPPWDYGELQVDELHTRHGESGQDLLVRGKWKRGASGARGGRGLGSDSRESGSEKTVPFHELSKRRKRGRKRGKQDENSTFWYCLKEGIKI